MAGDQWWPRTSGCRLRLADAMTHVMHYEFGYVVIANKRNKFKKIDRIFCLGGEIKLLCISSMDNKVPIMQNFCETSR